MESKAGSLKKINKIDKPLQNRAGSSEDISKLDKPQVNWGKQREDTNLPVSGIKELTSLQILLKGK